jgi:D-glycero-D-manno-heptose 1,7-bisphosphate phosphatase
MQRAVFLDRDDTLIADGPYLDNVAGVRLLPGAGDGLRAMKSLGFLLILVSNQSGIGRGLFPASMVEAQYERIQELLAPFGVRLDGMRFCPHLPADACDCRKPRPDMILACARERDIDCAASFMVGDKPSDIAAGRAAGCRTIRIGRAESGDAPADGVAADLVEAAAIIRRAMASGAGKNASG